MAAPGAVIRAGTRVFYEITFLEGGEEPEGQFGWATDKFEKSDEFSGEGVGDCSESFGFDGQYQEKCHNGE